MSLSSGRGPGLRPSGSIGLLADDETQGKQTVSSIPQQGSDEPGVGGWARWSAGTWREERDKGSEGCGVVETQGDRSGGSQ